MSLVRNKDPDLDPSTFFRSFQQAKKSKTFLLRFYFYLP
jgi:hypothetical protein